MCLTSVDGLVNLAPASSREMRNSFVMSSSGTVGDILPLLALARELVRRGHRVTFLTSSDHSALVKRAGAEFIQVYEPDWPHDGRDDAEFWRSVIVPGYDRTMCYLTERFKASSPPILVARAGNWAFRTFSELRHVPFFRAFLWPSAINEGRRWMPPAYRSMLDRFRGAWGIAEAGLNLYRTDSVGPSLSLFPSWFGEPESRLPKAGASVGFPFYDLGSIDLPAEVEAFAAEFGPFVIFTASSGQANVSSFRRAALAFCRETKQPTIVLTSDRSGQFERPADRIMYCGLVSHAAILPLSSMVVHNGGIGTVAQCIRAGVPQLITPLRYDQPDNARRVQSLGLGFRMDRANAEGPSYAKGHWQLMSDPGLQDRLRYRAEMVRKQDAAINAVEEIFSASSRET